MNQVLLRQLQLSAQKALAKNTRFHDYGHALEVLNNTIKLVKKEGGDRDTLYAAALFHDLSNYQAKGQEGPDGAKRAEAVLRKIKSFPKHKISEVKRLIISIDRDAGTADEILLSDADELAALSKLSICRGFMISGKRGDTLKAAIEDFDRYIDKRYNSFVRKTSHTATARQLAKQRYPFIKQFLTDCLDFYS